MPLALKILLFVAAGIIALFIALVFALMALRFKIKISYQEKFSVELYVGGIRIATIPTPPKKLRRLHTYTKKRAEKAAQKQARRPEDYLESIRQHALYRALMQRRAAKKATKNTAATKSTTTKSEQKQDKLNIEILLQMISELIDAFFDGTRKGLHIHVCRLHVGVVGKDAAATAITCGAVWAAISNFLAVLDAHAKLRTRKADVRVIPDYTGEQMHVDFCLIVSFSVFRTLHTLIPLIPVVLRHKDSLVISPESTQPATQKQ